MKDGSWNALRSTTPTPSCKASNEIERRYLFKLLNITSLNGRAKGTGRHSVSVMDAIELSFL